MKQAWKWVDHENNLDSGSFILKGVKNKKVPSLPFRKKYSNLTGDPDGENHVKIIM